MPDLIIKPKNQSGNKLILQDQAGGAVLTTADSGATAANVTLSNVTHSTGSIATTVTGFTGIKNAQIFRMHTSFDGNDIDPILNWENQDQDGGGTIGSVVTESSGIFTFPATGIWHIHFHGNVHDTNHQRYVDLMLYTTINNSSYIHAAYGSTFIGDSSSSQVFSESCCDTIFDVTDTSQCKCKFGMVVVGGDSITLRAESAANVSYVMFTRLGDT